MFRYKLLAAVLSLVVALAEEFSLLNADSRAPKVEEKLDNTFKEPSKLVEELKITPSTITVSASVYFPEPGQTDATPYITADGSHINKHNPRKQRWIAVSRDLHSRWGGKISYGDSLWVSGISDDLDGLYVVRDVMNRRIRNRIDILVGRKDRVMGFWNNVQIAKLD